MREFDDASLLATNTPLNQLPPIISDLQRIRREAEDLEIPICVATLKQLELAHMNTVINTLVGFLGGADQTTLNQGTEIARQQHNQYALEYARLLGLTVIAPPTPAPTGSPLPATPVVLYVLNRGTADVQLYADMNADSAVLGVLSPGQSSQLRSQSPDGQWLQLEVPGQAEQLGWVQNYLVVIVSGAP